MHLNIIPPIIISFDKVIRSLRTTKTNIIVMEHLASVLRLKGPLRIKLGADEPSWHPST